MGCGAGYELVNDLCCFAADATYQMVLEGSGPGCKSS